MKEYVLEYKNVSPSKVLLSAVRAENVEELKRMIENGSLKFNVEDIEFEDNNGEYTVIEEREVDESKEKINPLIFQKNWYKDDIMTQIEICGYDKTEENYNKVMVYNSGEIKDWLGYYYDEEYATIRDVIHDALS